MISHLNTPEIRRKKPCIHIQLSLNRSRARADNEIIANIGFRFGRFFCFRPFLASVGRTSERTREKEKKRETYPFRAGRHRQKRVAINAVWARSFRAQRQIAKKMSDPISLGRIAVRHRVQLLFRYNKRHCPARPARVTTPINSKLDDDDDFVVRARQRRASINPLPSNQIGRKRANLRITSFPVENEKIKKIKSR